MPLFAQGGKIRGTLEQTPGGQAVTNVWTACDPDAVSWASGMWTEATRERADSYSMMVPLGPGVSSVASMRLR